ERDVLHPVAVPADMTRDLVILAERAREDETDVALLEHVRGPVADARLRARVGRRREAEPALVEVRRLLRVPDPELDVIPAGKRHEVGRAHGLMLKRSPAARASSS